MSLFDLQDVCIVIGSLATLDLPMVVDLIRIYVLKGPYCTLTTTNWFLQALSVIPRGSWGDVASFGNCVDRSDQIVDRSYDEATVIGMNRMFIRWTGPAPALQVGRRPPSLLFTSRPPPSHAPPCRPLRDRTCSDHLVEEIPFVQNLSALLVQTDEGAVHPVVDLIRRSIVAYLLKCRFPCETGRSQAPRRQQGNDSNILYLVGGHLKTVDMTIKDFEDQRSVKPEAIVIGLHCILHFT
ncbi:F-box/kelch-repeat protein-like [Dorcoceras hygrometricum]|uniref:F-box/kelch-repeat protein-like n=1 Tax=Dorcoceras hygrometricum TaxID=472368 RepID=A0A2Z7CW80_9LAMI|nr:F-box/kelch-repeat protein-like [Dorcoceras hygrometricum]